MQSNRIHANIRFVFGENYFYYFQLEELSTVINMGILNSFANNPVNESNGVRRLKSRSEKDSILNPFINWDAGQKKNSLLSMVESNLSKVENELTSLR